MAKAKKKPSKAAPRPAKAKPAAARKLDLTPTGVWLMKTEPETFGFDDLVNAKNQTAPWDGVRNFQARNFLRDGMKKGDVALIYHSSTAEPAIVGMATVVKEGYPDPSAMNEASPLFDPKAKARGANPWTMVDVKATHRLATPLTRAMLAADPTLKGMLVMRRGMRLSIVPVAKAELKVIEALGKPTPLGR
jgi:predicted RNA-binding protein with PUA-like domain